MVRLSHLFLLVAATLAQACGPVGSDQAPGAATGTLTVPLQRLPEPSAPTQPFAVTPPAEIAPGYRLDGHFRLGDRVVLEPNEDGTRVEAELPIGDYALELLPEWTVVRVDAEGERAIPAELVSQNPLPISILPGRTTRATFFFEVDGEPIAMGDGLEADARFEAPPRVTFGFTGTITLPDGAEDRRALLTAGLDIGPEDRHLPVSGRWQFRTDVGRADRPDGNTFELAVHSGLDFELNIDGQTTFISAAFESDRTSTIVVNGDAAPFDLYRVMARSLRSPEIAVHEAVARIDLVGPCGEACVKTGPARLPTEVPALEDYTRRGVVGLLFDDRSVDLGLWVEEVYLVE